MTKFTLLNSNNYITFLIVNCSFKLIDYFNFKVNFKKVTIK